MLDDRLDSKQLLFAACMIACLLCGERARAAQAAVELKGGFPTTSKTRIFPLSKLKRGDKGVGYTVLAGDEVTKFDVEVLGILEGMLGPGKHVILARLTGPEIERTGVVSGMSGSPVYIDGLLVGAVGYRFGAFTKEAIGGITPIESMLDVYESPEVEPPPTQRGSVLLPSGNQGTRLLPGRTRGITVGDFRERGGLPAITLPKVRPVVGPYDPEPIETPIMISGLVPEVADELRATLHDAGFVTVGGGASRRGVAARVKGVRQLDKNETALAGGVRAAPIAPGAPIAAVLMRGDVYIAATGTVTLVDGPNVLAFGHPFLGYGNVTFPMATASILNTLAMDIGSVKQGAPALEVGAITHDRVTAIAGRIGSTADMVPVHIRIDRSDGHTAPSDSNFEVVRDGLWLPMLTEAAIASAASSRIGYEAGGTVDLEARVQIADRTLAFTDTYSSEPPLRVSAFAARDVSNTIGLITRNNIVPAEVRSVDVSLKVRADVAVAVLEEVVPDRNVVRPGDRLDLTARLRSYKKDPVAVRFSIDIPRDARGDIEIYVGGSIEVDRREGDVFGERFPHSLDELLGILAERRPGRGVYARVIVPRPGLRSNADFYSSLPAADRAMLSMEPGKLTKAVNEAFGPAQTIPFKDTVIGGIAVPITVVR